jgi:hypothetical protein
MTDAGRELGLLRSIAADLDTYLKSDVVFWSLTDAGSFRHHYPQLTLGGLLLTQARLAALANRLDPAQQTEWAQTRQAIHASRARWRANWLRKAGREIETRVNSWARAVRDLSAAEYPAAVQSRLMLALLLDDVGGEPVPGLEQQQARLATLDTLLRHKLKAGRFALDPDLQPAFPPEPYWFLYGAPEAE